MSEKISEAELVVMEALWECAPQTANDVADRVVERRGWSLQTVKTLLSRLMAKDVIHSFKMPVMRITQDVIPGMEIPIWFEAKSTGNFQLGCAQLCGLGHYEMKADLIIQTQEDFQKWLDEEHEALGLDDY